MRTNPQPDMRPHNADRPSPVIQLAAMRRIEYELTEEERLEYKQWIDSQRAEATKDKPND
jgi:hypothetical protein